MLMNQFLLMQVYLDIILLKIVLKSLRMEQAIHGVLILIQKVKFLLPHV